MSGAPSPRDLNPHPVHVISARTQSTMSGDLNPHPVHVISTRTQSTSSTISVHPVHHDLNPHPVHHVVISARTQST